MVILPLTRWGHDLRRLGHATSCKANGAIRPDQGDGPFHDEAVGLIELGDLPAFVHEEKRECAAVPCGLTPNTSMPRA